MNGIGNLEDLATFLPIEGDTWPASTIVVPVIGILFFVAVGLYGRKLASLFSKLRRWAHSLR